MQRIKEKLHSKFAIISFDNLLLRDRRVIENIENHWRSRILISMS